MGKGKRRREASYTIGIIMKNKFNITKNFNQNALKLIQKAVLTGIGVAASKESMKKAATGVYNDVQEIIQNFLKDLEKKGKIKTKETQKILQQLQKKSEAEKSKIYSKLQKEGQTLLKAAREILLTPISVLKDATSSLNLKDFKSNGNSHKGKRNKSKRKR